MNKLDDSAVRQPICIKNYIKTLEYFKYLWLKLKSVGFKFLLLRNINQDSLECFFGFIRSHGSRNNMPNCYHFSTSFKTLLLNNFSSLKSLGNCELDDSIGALDILKQFLSGPNEVHSIDVSLNFSLNSFNVELAKSNKSAIGEMTIGYVAGYIVRTLIKSINNCNICKNDCIDIHNFNELINVRNYSDNRLKTPSQNFNNIIEHILNIFTQVINSICYKPHIFKSLHLLIEVNVDFNFLCKIHNLKQMLIKKLISFLLFTWCKNINRVLSGADSKMDNNTIKIMAKEYYIKYKTKKRGYNK